MKLLQNIDNQRNRRVVYPHPYFSGFVICIFMCIVVLYVLHKCLLLVVICLLCCFFVVVIVFWCGCVVCICIFRGLFFVYLFINVRNFFL